MRSNSCFGGYKEREDRSPCLTAVVLDDRASVKSLAASQQTIQVNQNLPFYFFFFSSDSVSNLFFFPPLKTTFLQTRSDLDPISGSNYTIKLVDNDLIVETQVKGDPLDN